MLLPAHNAHLVSVSAPPNQGDPVLGQPTTAAQVKWTGDAQAMVRDDLVEEVRGNQRILVREILVTLPSNVPVQINEHDLLELNINTGESVTMQVRNSDAVFWGLGQTRYTCRYL